jgi:hypothetical protein
MPMLLQCFLHFHPTASTMDSFLHFSDLHNPNVPRSLRHEVPAAVNLSLQLHNFHPRLQGPMYSVILYHGLFYAGKAAEHTADTNLHLLKSLRMHEAIIPLPNMPLWHGVYIRTGTTVYNLILSHCLRTPLRNIENMVAKLHIHSGPKKCIHTLT